MYNNIGYYQFEPIFHRFPFTEDLLEKLPNLSLVYLIERHCTHLTDKPVTKLYTDLINLLRCQQFVFCIDGAFNTVTVSPKPDVSPIDKPYIRTFIGIKLRIYGITYIGTRF